MRDIKFRAFDKETKTMVYPEDTRYVLSLINGEWSLSDYAQLEYETDEYGLYDIELPHETSDIEVMQYTGMKDVNGVEIYEGDIVKRTYLFDGAFGKTHIGEVVYDTYYARHVISKPNKFIEPKTEDLGNMLSYRSTYEVIGNIYENPELLED